MNLGSRAFPFRTSSSIRASREIHTLFMMAEYHRVLMRRHSRCVALAAIALVLTGCSQPLLPVPVISVDHDRGYPPLEVTFDASGSQGVKSSIVGTQWDFSDGTSASTVAAIHTFYEQGDYHVVLTVTDAEGLTASNAMTIHVLNRVPHAAFRISPFGAPRDYPVQFDASESYDLDGEIVTFHWDFGDGTVAEGMHTEHIFPQQQTEYLVTLTVIDDSGAANASIRMVAVLGCDTCG